MSKKVFLVLLLPYAFLLAWSLKRLHFSVSATTVLCILSIGVVWGILYASFSLAIFDRAGLIEFAPVEQIMSNEQQQERATRYVAENLGWLVALIYFWMYWGLARLSLWRQPNTT